jgi:hypothetical protein
MRKFYYWLIANLGINPKTTASFFFNIPRYLKECFTISKNFDGTLRFVPYLNDRKAGAGDFMHEYFIQDVFAAQLVYDLNPGKVVDVGSRIDGYIGHLITFRQVELIDIRPVTAEIKNLKFLQMNFSDPAKVEENYTDFVSCLHSIEHFGLGRYGDPIDLNAVPSAMRSFNNILKSNGTLLLSTTFGRERIEFNKQWIFNFDKMIQLLKNSGFNIGRLFYLNSTHFVESDAFNASAICDKKDTLVIMLCQKR